jgi:hypothetical protein
LEEDYMSTLFMTQHNGCKYVIKRKTSARDTRREQWWFTRRSTFSVRITAPAANSANATANTSDFLTEADHERVRPKNTMKKNGPQRSQSLRAFPGSSLYGLGNTTSFKLLTIRDRSRFTVSHTGSVNVLGGDPKALAPWKLLELLTAGRGGGTGTCVTF